MSLLSLLPTGTKFRFTNLRKAGFLFSILLIIGSAVSFFGQSLNFGIDFKGGVLIEVRYDQPANLSEMRNTLSTLGLGEVALQEFGAPTDVLIRVQRQEGGDAAQQVAVTKIKQALGEDLTYRRTEVVGPTVGAELIESGIIAVLVALAVIALYIWIRFEWHFGVCALLALTHDVLTTIGLFSITQIEFNLGTVAAILTIAGYSINDTVVVFDRVRENLRKYKKIDLAELLDQSLNETLSRTMLTSITTLLAVLSLVVLGGEVIRGFAIALIWGVVIGTYSSIFLAVPLLLVIKGDLAAIRGEKETDAPTGQPENE